MEKEKTIEEEIKEAKERKRAKNKLEPKLEQDTSFMDIQKENKEKTKTKKNKNNYVKNMQVQEKIVTKENKKDILTFRGEEFKIEKEEIKEKKKKDKTEKSKLSIFFLILALGVILFYGYYLYQTIDFKSLEIIDIVKQSSFFLISLVVILILFKVNTKKSTPYILFLTLLLIIYSVFSVSYSKEELLYVTDFINKDYSEVLEWADKYNINLTTLHEFSDTVLYNHVIMQEYGVTTLVSDIKSFNVTISDGPNLNKEIIVPNFTGFKFDDVMKYINENHLANVEIEFIISDKEKDTVIEQIGSGTMKRNDNIKFIFSYGEEIETVLVKDLKNLSLFEATTYLKRYGIKYEIEYEFSDKIKKNYVISQDKVNEIVDSIKLKVSKGVEIKVPNLSKMTTTEISKWATSNNIKIKYESVYNKDYENGKVIKASREENDIVEEGFEIIITISKGSLIMPKVENISDFKLWATDNNIHYEENFEFSTTIKNGELININFKEGEKITENDTIILTISKGRSVKIPNLVGLSKSEIQNKCKNASLSCSFKYGGLTESVKKDISISQSKKSGLTVAEGSNVTITLSSGIVEKVNVPNFTGKNKSEISSTCNNLGIKCNFNYTSNYSSTPYDNALNQDKSGLMNKGSTINITLSKGSAKTFTKTIDANNDLVYGNPEQTKKVLQSKLTSECPGVNFIFSFEARNTGIGYLSPNSDVKVGNNTFVQGKTYKVIIVSAG